MRIIFSWLITLLPVSIIAQQVYTEPAFPTQDAPVTIFFDATGSALENISGSVYVHTGVIISEADLSSGNWRYVIAPWPSNPNDNLPKARMNSLGNNLWELHIENIREYYGIPQSVARIYQLAFVFRNAGGTQQTANIYVDLYTNPVNVRIISPQVSLIQPFFGQLGQEVDITAIGNAQNDDLESISLFANDELLWQVTDTDTLEFTYTIVDRGRVDFRVVAENEAGDWAMDEFYLIVNPEIQDIPLPEGIRDGINYHENDDSKVTLSLYAPHKSFVYVIGDFNDWELDEQYFMNRDYIREDSVRFWLTLEDLEPGKEYGFQYLIDGNIRVADAYTEKVLDPWHDAEIISKGVYPGLIPYPSGKTEWPVSVLQTAQEPYQWEVTDFVPPAPEKLVIYELLIRDFIHDHSYKTLADTLDYLQRLGVNAIELMPVNQFEGNLSWGYNPSFYFAPDKYYGPARELKRFIDEAHKRGIAVILDIVWNHSYGLSPLLRMYYDANNGRPSDENPWYHDQIYSNPSMRFGYKFNHGSPAFKEFMKRGNQFWLEEYKIDGFRFDLTKGFTTRLKGDSDPWGSAYDQERINNLNRLQDEIWDVNPNAYVILEHLADNSEETVLANRGMLLWGNLNHQYNEATMGFNSDLRWGIYRERNWNDPNLITYMESHDEERLVFRNTQFGNISGEYNTRQLDTALDRVALASTLFYTIPGPKMLWQFGEMGYDFSINRCTNGTIDNGCRLSPKPIRWDYLQQENRKKLFNVTADLIYLKTNYDAFNTTDFDYSLNGGIKRVRLNGDELKVVAVGNFLMTNSVTFTRFYHPGTWYEYFSGDSIHLTTTDTLLPLNAGQYQLYLSQKIRRPSGDFISSAGEIVYPELMAELFPNPSDENGFYLNAALEGNYIVTVRDLTGRVLYSSPEQWMGGGSMYIDIGTHISPGVYTVQVENATAFKTFKWVRK